MGKKSRLKREKKESKLQEQVDQPTKVKTSEFLAKRGLSEEEGETLGYLVSMQVNFSVYRTIKQGIALPSVKPEHEKLDDSRVEGLNKELEDTCQKLGVDVQDVIDEIVTPLCQDESIIYRVLENIYDILETLVPTENFRKMTEEQMEDVEAWGDSLADYEDRKEEYFQALKEIFALHLSVVRQGSGQAPAALDLDAGLAEIKEHYGLTSDQLEQLVRRATEFLRVAFANYLEIDFQGVRLELHARSHGIKAEDDGL